MITAELDDFLAGQRTCRVATVGARGPHLTPLWYIWDETALWLSSVVASQRWADLQRDPRVAVLVDAGEDYGELCGAELRGAVEVVGEVPAPAHKTSGPPDPSVCLPASTPAALAIAAPSTIVVRPVTGSSRSRRRVTTSCSTSP